MSLLFLLLKHKTPGRNSVTLYHMTLQGSKADPGFPQSAPRGLLSPPTCPLGDPQGCTGSLESLSAGGHALRLLQCTPGSATVEGLPQHQLAWPSPDWDALPLSGNHSSALCPRDPPLPPASLTELLGLHLHLPPGMSGVTRWVAALAHPRSNPHLLPPTPSHPLRHGHTLGPFFSPHSKF